MASPTNQVKNVTTTHPHIKLAGPAYNRLCPYRGVPVNTAIHENVIASVLKKLCKQTKPTNQPNIYTSFQFSINVLIYLFLMNSKTVIKFIFHGCNFLISRSIVFQISSLAGFTAQIRTFEGRWSSPVFTSKWGQLRNNSDKHHSLWKHSSYVCSKKTDVQPFCK